jgi:5-formyltetrahydrofolate cyclo-ligase
LVSALQDASPDPRHALRRRLIVQREAFVAGPDHAGAAVALSRHLIGVVSALEPDSLGLYWPHRSEFNAVPAIDADAALTKLPMSLPFAHRTPVQMTYRAWNRLAPTAVDDCGIPTASGTTVVPDVVLVPCVGFTAAGFRLGYGGGYFDRWLAQHPHVTTIGVAWACGRLHDDEFTPEGHDRPLTLVLTENGVV